MGKPDVYESDYLNDDRRFADLINGALYEGSQVVLPQDLEEADAELVFIGGRHAKKVICDKTRKWKKKGILFAILTVENQNYVDYAMVLRCMLMEAMGYHKQWKRRKRLHAVNKDLKGTDAFLSGINRKERFVPIVPLIVYYGTKKRWDGARTLHELLDIQGEKDLKPFINDYKINLFDFHEKKSFGEFRTELQTLFEFLRYADDEEQLGKVMQQNSERYERLDYETARLLSELTEISQEIQWQDQLTDINGERGEVNMCKAWEDHKMRGILEGKIEGKIEGKLEERKRFVLNMLQHGMTDTDICELAECDMDFVNDVRLAQG